MTVRELPVRVTYMQKTAPDDAACASCRWWNMLPRNNEFGACQRRAPVAVQNGLVVSASWPNTEATDLCGEWEAMP